MEPVAFDEREWFPLEATPPPMGGPSRRIGREDHGETLSPRSKRQSTMPFRHSTLGAWTGGLPLGGDGDADASVAFDRATSRPPTPSDPSPASHSDVSSMMDAEDQVPVSDRASVILDGTAEGIPGAATMTPRADELPGGFVSVRLGSTTRDSGTLIVVDTYFVIHSRQAPVGSAEVRAGVIVFRLRAEA